MKAAQAELKKAFAGTETEKALRLSLENKLLEMKKMREGNMDMALVLEEKDRSGSVPVIPDSHLSGSKGKELSLLSPSPSFPPCYHGKKTRTVRRER